MNRRQFLNLTGGTSFASVLSGARVHAGEPLRATPPFLDRDLLRARNRNRSTVVCRNGMVCASQPLAAMAGMDVLKEGGNCIDAAICTNAMLGLTEPASNGIGGDLFAIVWLEKERKLYGLNASGRAPHGWNLDDALEMGWKAIPAHSPLSWTVPGCVSGWGMLNKRFGRLGLAECLQAAIHYAKEGFPLSPIISSQFRFRAPDEPGLAKVYHPGGKVPGYGSVFKNPLLAASYESIARGGPAAFYEGDIAERIVAKSKELGGRMAIKDFKNHTANWVIPVRSSYRGWDVCEIPPNGQGIAAIQILNILEKFEIGDLSPNSPEHLHLFVEAKKLAFEDRAQFYADMDHADVPVEWLVSKDYARRRAALINPRKSREEIKYGDPDLDSDTVYLTAADAEGNMISLIQSLYHGFGSRICPDGVGFPIQNRGKAFSLDPEHRNRLQPNKRPFHTIIPGFLTREGRPVMSFGVMGGDFQPQGHAQVIMNMIDFGMSPQQAGDQPRLSHSGSSSPWGAKSVGPGYLTFERGFDDRVKIRLAEMGHRFQSKVGVHGGYQAIWRLDDPLRYFGASDPRKDGVALGY